MTATTPATKTESAAAPAKGTSVGKLFNEIRKRLPMTSKAEFEKDAGLFLKLSVDPAVKLEKTMTLALLAKHDALIADGKPVSVETMLDESAEKFAWLREDIKLLHAAKVRAESPVIDLPLPKGNSRANVVEEWFPKLLGGILQQEYLGKGEPPKPRYKFKHSGLESATSGGFHDKATADAYFARFPKPEKEAPAVTEAKPA